MKKRELIIAEQAIDDLTDIWVYIATDSIRNADRFIDFLHEKCSAKWEKARKLFENNPSHPSLNTELLEPQDTG